MRPAILLGVSIPLIATCALGLEGLLEGELRGLGVSDVRPERGAVSFRGSWRDCWRANLQLRTANRILVALASWSAPNGDALASGIQGLLEGRKVRGAGSVLPQLGELLVPDRSFAIHASCSASSITDPRWASLRGKDGICDAQRGHFGRRADVDRDNPDLPLRLRLHRDRATLLLDSSGEPLDRRGYRRAPGTAPVRETLAAACVLASGWDGQGPIVDPMCGTGTLLVEAAWFAQGRSPGCLRDRWAFQALPGFDAAAFAALRGESPSDRDAPQVELIGTDLDPVAVRAAKINLRAAGLGRSVRLDQVDGLRAPPPRQRGLLVVNPPHGHRIDGAEGMWRSLGRRLREAYGGWAVVLLGGERSPLREIGFAPEQVLEVRNGPLKGQIIVLRPRPSRGRPRGRGPGSGPGRGPGRPSPRRSGEPEG